MLAWYDTIQQGTAMRLPLSELLAWATVTGNVVSPDEYAILRDMNAAWVAAMNGEIEHSRNVKADRDKGKK